MAGSTNKKAASSGFIKKIRGSLSSAAKRMGPFMGKVGTVLKTFFQNLKPFFVKAGHFFGALFKKLYLKFLALSGEGKLIASGCAVLVVAAIVFAVALAVPPKVEEEEPLYSVEDNGEFSYDEEYGSEDDEEELDREEDTDIEAPAATPTPAPFTEPLSKGYEGPLVATVQSRLMVLGYMDDDEPTEHFGSLTKDALTIFQKHNNLPADGVLQEATYSALFSTTAEAYVLQIGDAGDDVIDVQERLYELGYLGKDYITGTYGEKTEAAVKDFQRSNKLGDDGKVGSATMERLYSDDVVGNFFKKGESNDTIKLYQERLKELGYLSSSYKPTGKMDNETIAAIKDFQEKNDLVADGCLGPTTMAKLDSSNAVAYALQLGMKGSKVKELQKRLNKLGYLKSNQVTGYYGEETEDAVRAFQHRNGLKEDGQAGSKTLQKLNSDSALKAKKAATPKPTKKPSKPAKPTKKGSKATPKPTKKGSKATPKPSKKSATATPNPSGSKADRMVSIAKTKLGCPYVRGKKGPDSFDCSGFVYWCLKQVGVNQSYLTSSGWRHTSRYPRFTSLSQAKKGDVLVFSGTSDGTGHVGICIGGGQMIDASSGAGKVRITSLSGNYWKVHFICGYHIWG